MIALFYNDKYTDKIFFSRSDTAVLFLKIQTLKTYKKTYDV